MNVIARLEYELAYYDSAVHRFNHYTTRTPPIRAYANHSLVTPYHHTHTHVVHLVASKILIHLYQLRPVLIWSDVSRSTATFDRSISNRRLFQNPKFRKPSLRGWRQPPTAFPAHFQSGSLLWQMMFVISFPRGRARAPSDYDTWTKRHRVVQSLTKLNNKI